MDAQLDDMLRRFIVDQDHASLEDLVEAARPLVASVCRRQVRDRALAEDAAQETLIKLVRRASTVHGNVAGWLAVTARRTCLDRLRRQASHDRAVRAMAAKARPSSDGVLSWESALRHLDFALAELDPATRSLVRDRFLAGRKLRELAHERGASVAKMSRDVTAALTELAEVFRGVGFEEADDACLHAALNDDLGLAHGMRREADPCATTTPPQTCPSGWSRPIRIGVLLTYTGTIVPNDGGMILPMARQCGNLHLALDPAFDFVALLEPGTDHHGVVERHVRDLDLTAGVLDATDEQALQTLDVIWFGRHWAIAPAIARAVRRAIEAGVGLFSEGEKTFGYDNPDVQALLLSASRPHMCCTGVSHGRHHLPLPATVQRAHRALPALYPGRTLMADGCAMHVDLAPNAQALVTFDGERPPSCRCDQCLAHPERGITGRPTVVATGMIGRGRALVFYINHVADLLAQAGQHHIRDVLLHLAEPRRLACASAGR